ncbi:hypothetical protein ABT090_20790 [Streptomyces asoensis]|uniref:hypothetical protein n=1 Tax=Streptomyces asoensis TaxID=249586 RepID=UPI00332FBF68
MSLIDRLPTRRPRPVRKHRADDRIAVLEAELHALRKVETKLLKSLAAADEFFTEQHANVTALEQELAQEKRGRATAEAEVETRDRWIKDLKRELDDVQHRLDVACQATAAADQTQEIDPDAVARICGRPVPLYEAPFATVDPGRVRPSWARTT